MTYDRERILKQPWAWGVEARRGRRRRNLLRRQPSDDRARQTEGGDDDGAPVHQHRAAPGNRAEQDREKGPRFNQGVARDQLLVPEMLRQQRVLDRTEDGRVHPEAEERDEEERNA